MATMQHYGNGVFIWHINRDSIARLSMNVARFKIAATFVYLLHTRLKCSGGCTRSSEIADTSHGTRFVAASLLSEQRFSCCRAFSRFSEHSLITRVKEDVCVLASRNWHARALERGQRNTT
jgi:hypothetical protein